MFETIIRNGHVIDPLNNADKICDIAIKNGKIEVIGENLPKCENEFNAENYFVVPGLIDCHVHCYQHSTLLGVNPDETCLARGKSMIPEVLKLGHCQIGF